MFLAFPNFDPESKKMPKTNQFNSFQYPFPSAVIMLCGKSNKNKIPSLVLLVGNCINKMKRTYLLSFDY